MAERRMFSKAIIQSARFLTMPVSTRELYFQLGLNADDEGVVEAFPVIRMINATEDDLKLLVTKKFVIVLNEELVTYITDWKENNLIRADRFKESNYHQLLLKFTDMENAEKADEIGLNEAWQPNDNQVTTKCHHRLGKVRLGKDSIKNTSVVDEPQPDDTTNEHITLPLKDGNTYRVTEDQVKSWRNAFPSVNIPQELRKMCVWSETNPSKQKSRRGIQRFIVNWLSREQEKSEEKRARSLGAVAEYQKDVMPVYDDSKNPTVSQKELDDFFKEKAS